MSTSGTQIWCWNRACNKENERRTMVIFMTGDTHGDFGRFSARAFPEQKHLSKDDYVIICGDFGGIWDGSEAEQRALG